MSVYIKGMEMPSCGLTVTIYPDGRVVQFLGYGEKKQLGTAIPVPDHGRLVDADALYEECTPIGWDGKSRSDYVCAITGHQLKNAPTIIPAEEGE